MTRKELRRAAKKFVRWRNQRLDRAVFDVGKRGGVERIR
jgi:hypothetical protein